ncbi:MAG TPA: Gp37 family protein [Candidatus Binataceae bacterium]|nr:Gp37 family protein [Candidatus Binataceae bacterium]
MGAMLDAPFDGATFSPPTPIDIATIESAILAQLGSQINSIEIAHYPDRPESYRMTHRIGAALVQYKGAAYGEQLDTAAIIQERKLEFEVTLMMRDLGWSYGGDASGPSPGAYAAIEAVRAALTGFRVPGCRKMFPKSEKFVERDRQGGVWIYAITFALSTLALEASGQEGFPLFIRGIAMEEGGVTSITVGAASYTFDATGKIQLPNGNVFAVQVTGPGGAPLAEGTDFAVDAVNGIITALTGGATGPGETVGIAYSYADQVIASAGQSAPTN